MLRQHMESFGVGVLLQYCPAGANHPILKTYKVHLTRLKVLIPDLSVRGLHSFKALCLFWYFYNNDHRVHTDIYTYTVSFLFEMIGEIGPPLNLRTSCMNIVKHRAIINICKSQFFWFSYIFCSLHCPTVNVMLRFWFALISCQPDGHPKFESVVEFVDWI